MPGQGLANGLPLSALVGRREIMQAMESKKVFFSMTFGGETLSLAAAKATLTELHDKDVPGYIWRQGERFQRAFNDLAETANVPVRCQGQPPRLSLAFPGTEGRELVARRSLFLQELVKRGVLTNGTLLFSFTHSDQDVEETLAACEAAIHILGDAIANGSVEDRIEGVMPSGESIIAQARRVR